MLSPSAGPLPVGPLASCVIGRLYTVVIGCPDPDELAGFYEKLLSLSRQEDTGDFVVLQNAAGTPVVLFQRVDDFRAPRWTST